MNWSAYGMNLPVSKESNEKIKHAEKAFEERFSQRLDEYYVANDSRGFRVLAFNRETEDFTFQGPLPHVLKTITLDRTCCGAPGPKAVDAIVRSWFGLEAK